MRIGRFSHRGQSFTGCLEDDGIVYPIMGDIFKDFKLADRGYPLADLKIFAPCKPSKIICVGLNYHDHVAELDLAIPKYPLLFLKAPTAIIGPNEAIVLPPDSQQVDYEGELALVVKRHAKNIPPREVAEHILGYTCANDVTARDLQKLDGQWTRSKSFDTFCPIGPYIVTDIDPSCLTVEVFLNGVLKQHTSTSHFIFAIPELVSLISNIMTLLPGDIILTGTASGVGSMGDGDKIVVSIEDVGKLINPVIKQ